MSALCTVMIIKIFVKDNMGKLKLFINLSIHQKKLFRLKARSSTYRAMTASTKTPGVNFKKEIFKENRENKSLQNVYCKWIRSCHYKRFNNKRWICKTIVLLNILTVLCLIWYNRNGLSGFNDNYFRITNQRMEESAPKLKFKTCEFPKLEPFGDEILPFLKHPVYIKCVHEANIIGERVFEVKKGTRILRKISNDYDYKDCCFRPFYRTNDAEQRSKNDCFPILNNSTELSVEHEFIEVFCHGGMDDYRDGFAIVAEKPSVEESLIKFRKVSENQSQPRDKLNVIILGIDATSRMNFLRMMPKSHSYLTNLSAIVMKGYTKVAENTLPNVIPLLTGLTLEEFKSKCVKSGRENNDVHLDLCPFIWQRFAAHGYRTSFAEDDVSISIFNMNWKFAFESPPTDYYLRPFSSHMQYRQGSGMGYCLGTRLSFKVLLDNIENTAVAFDNDKPYFQFTWATRLSHDDFNKLSLGDKPLTESLEFLFENGHLNNTALIVMSDHGSRLANIGGTNQGQLEDRMPLFYIVLPPWFKDKYSAAWKNLNDNSEKVTSSFDVFETLKDFMDLGRMEENKTEDSHHSHSTNATMDFMNGIKKPLSLFKKIPSNRTCIAAGIPIHWCVCHQKTKIIDLNSLEVADAAFFIIRSINYLLKDQRSCATLKLDNITEAFVLNNNEIELNGNTNVRIFYLSFITSPSGAYFEATVLQLNEDWILTEKPARISAYEGQSNCVQQEYKPYCFCKNEG